MNNLGALKQILGKQEEAQDFYRLAGAYRAQGRYAEAESAFSAVPKDSEAQYGQTSSEYAKTLTELAELYRRMGRPTQAAPLAERALAITGKLPGAADVDIATKAHTLAAVYRLLRYQFDRRRPSSTTSW